MSNELQLLFAASSETIKGSSRAFWLIGLGACLMLRAGSLGAQGAPTPEPEQERPAPGRASKKEPTAKTSPAIVHRKTARIVLGDGRTVRGLALFRAPTAVTFKHMRAGIAYSKRFDVSEIESIRIRQWRARFVRRSKDGEIFHFEPYEFEVRLKSGATLARKGSFFSFLKQFPIQNDNGRVLLFTFWVDLRKADGSWYTGMQGTERTEAHKDVVRMVEFVAPKPEPESDQE